MSLEAMLLDMALIRFTEEALLDLYSKGLLRGTVHTCLGQEACAVGVVKALDFERDVLYSNHRGHGHYLAYSGDVKGLIAEIIGRPDGVCRGVGGSQHLQLRNFYSNGIQGAGTPITVGMALAEKRKCTGAIAVAFLGDGTFGEGVVYESFNLASLYEAPILYVVEHNGYAQSTPSRDQHAGRLETRAESFGIPVTIQDGMDVEAVSAVARDLAAAVREKQCPQLLFLNTYRFGPHSKGDDHRDPSEISEERKRDPIVLCANRLDGESASRVVARARAAVDGVLAELAVA